MEKSLYPKTKRFSTENKKIVITEKLDGSNIGFFKLNDDLVIATRNNVFMLSELDQYSQIVYKGMYGWLKEHGQFLIDNLHEQSGFFGEWMGMGKLSYPDLDKKVYMFAKANVDENLDVRNINYDLELFKYPFINQEMPEFIGVVPIVALTEEQPSIRDLDEMYYLYSSQQNRNVEGFIINNHNNIVKYVRMKNGKIEDHHS